MMYIVFRVDASITIGSGHVMRCLTLADQLRGMGGIIYFICRTFPGSLEDIIKERGNMCFMLPELKQGCFEQDKDADETILAMHHLGVDKWDWLVVDHYGLDAIWERHFSASVKSLMVIDDLANRKHECNLLLDQNYYDSAELRYHSLVPSSCELLLGPKYVLLRPEFITAIKRQRIRTGEVRKIMVSFGGSDPSNLTATVLQAIYFMGNSKITYDIVVGNANPKQDQIRQLCAALPNVTYYHQTSRMAELINKADLGVGAGGASMWERCCLGLPTITVIAADNQTQTTLDVARSGAIHCLGHANELQAEDFVSAIVQLCNEQDRLKKISQCARAMIPNAELIVAQRMMLLQSSI